MTAVGSVVFFQLGSDEITHAADAVLHSLAEQLRGKPQKIEVRGHVSAEYAARTEGTDEAMMLAFRRAAAVRRVLVEREGLEAPRFRISSAGENEPMSRTGRSSAIARNPRVEVFLLDETVDDLRATANERNTETVKTIDGNRENQ